MSVPGVWNVTQWDASVWTTESVPVGSTVPDYTALQAEVASIIKNTAVTSDDIDAFINRAHDKIIRDLMSERYGSAIPMQMMVRGTTTTDAQSGATVPNNFIKARDVKVRGLPARYVSPEQVQTGAPGLAEAPIEMDYYEKPVRLSAANPTNWLLNTASDAYIYGACLQFVPWSKEFDNVPLWTPFYEDAIRGLKRAFGPQPRGNLVRRKSNIYRYLYTIVGSTLLFATTHRPDSAQAAT